MALASVLRLLLAIALLSSATTAMRVVTYNLRFDSKPDNITVAESINALPDPLAQIPFLGKSGEQPWSTRRIKVFQHLVSEGVVLANFQEALVRQVHDLATLLGDGWGWIGVGRDDGVNAGEFSPIFFKKSEFELLSQDFFWLSDTPDEPSKFPGAGSIRIASVARLTHKTAPGGPVTFTHINTHLDEQSDAQRRLGASLILTRARFEAFKTDGPVLVTGDFNSAATGRDAGAYQIITGAIPPVPVNATFAARYAVPEGTLPDFKTKDLKAEAPRLAVSGEFATFTGFAAPSNTSAFTRIDFVFGGSNGKWRSDAYKVGTSLTDDGVLASDHRPVFADITLLP